MDERLLLAMLVTGAVVGAVAWARGARWVRGWRLQARMAKARRREAEGAALLEGAGYTIVGTQVTAPCVLRRDGELLAPDVRADYLVRRWGRTYVAEAKSGPRATDPTERATRRQLLEYAVTYDVDGVLLVDTEAGRVSTIEFPGLRRKSGFLLGLGVGSVLGLSAALMGFLLWLD